MNFYNTLIEKSKEDNIVKNVVGAVIINNQQEVLLLTREKSDFMGGIDELPSGNMEENETIKEALIREVKEETNLEVKEIKQYINYFDYLSGSGKKARQYNFLVEVETKEIVLTEHQSYKWVSIEEALTNTNITKEVKLVLEIYKFNN